MGAFFPDSMTHKEGVKKKITMLLNPMKKFPIYGVPKGENVLQRKHLHANVG